MIYPKLILRIRSLSGHLRTIIRSLLGIWLFDPIEVFYIVDEKKIYPINSKSGNSSLKLMIINQYVPTFKSSFPEIHHVDPFKLTGGKVQRLFFHRKTDYGAFCQGKDVVLVIRDPVARLRSGYLGLIREHNRWYAYPSNLHNIFNVKASMSVEGLLRFVNWIPDNIADKHFRSQSFYLSGSVTDEAREVQVAELSYYLSEWRHGKVDSQKDIHLNKSVVDKALNADLSIINRDNLIRRFTADFELYDQVKEQGIITLFRRP